VRGRAFNLSLLATAPLAGQAGPGPLRADMIQRVAIAEDRAQGAGQGETAAVPEAPRSMVRLALLAMTDRTCFVSGDRTRASAKLMFASSDRSRGRPYRAVQR
jgi:hypothetical protein